MRKEPIAMRRVVCVWGLLLLARTGFSQGGQIRGIVTDDAGKPVEGAYAVATPQSGDDHRSRTVVTAKSGEYSIENLKPGKYSICIHAPGREHLDSCQWSIGTEVSIDRGQIVANPPVSIVQGALLKIRIDDPRKLMGADDDLLVGIYLPSGLFQPMRLASGDPRGRTYDIAVPKQTAVKVAVASTHLQISDDRGTSLSPRPASQKPEAVSATSSVINVPASAVGTSSPVIFTVISRK